jgi:hypothetical protein
VRGGCFAGEDVIEVVGVGDRGGARGLWDLAVDAVRDCVSSVSYVDWWCLPCVVDHLCD